ncbi:hypothetical protein A3I25_01930 [Candidatus Nomurabacteria bacterium RIFCSPLOWO2_02_FULL_42_17]|uniref:Uncharacterized protein n=2 Tax=Candidatus Nomuraibacteriota TaxID=1752729 RepID=A0A1F6WK54_9BACT|nr:MAG: hypothetical protein A3B93_01440 [Candidatus Nomurabacteria bacterium RIFCSPHIGHO2_02_FULL_42_24]OGI97567.1 MAG: hypothetical protein A3I25_01930 [Candidatus Nomurabacteria bacterium RIFCSPLOWO2_02_FULL_42_17]
MRNKYILLTTLIIFAIAFSSLFFLRAKPVKLLYFNDSQVVIKKGDFPLSLSPSIFAEAIRKNQNDKYPPEDQVGTRTFLFTQLSKFENKLISFVAEEWKSGSGGIGGFVIISGIDGKNIRVVGSFSHLLIDSITKSPKGEYIAYTEGELANLCIYRKYSILDIEKEQVVNLIPPTLLNTPIRVKMDQLSLEGIEWVTQNVLELQAPETDCLKSPLDSFLVRYWRYNINTKVYFSK